MMASLRIGVAEDNPQMLEFYQTRLAALGHEVTTSATTGEELVEGCRAARPDLVITDIRMPDMDGIDATAEICRDGPLPVILVSAHHDAELIERAQADHVLAYLVKPIKGPDLETAIALAMHRFREFSALQQESADIRQALADRKVIERAKGILMQRTGLDEPDAFARLQRMSRDKRARLTEIAQTVIDADEMLK